MTIKHRAHVLLKSSDKKPTIRNDVSFIAFPDFLGIASSTDSSAFNIYSLGGSENAPTAVRPFPPMPSETSYGLSRGFAIKQPARDAPVPLERRNRTRSRLQWRVCFWGPPLTGVVETVTRNLSSDGFHCLSRIPLPIKETVSCTLLIPIYKRNRAGSALQLECSVQVTRIEPVNEEGFFGLGCRIKDYRFLRLPSNNAQPLSTFIGE
jgi:hypothetical protein